MFGLRCAEHVAASRGAAWRDETPVEEIEAGVAALARGLTQEGGFALRDIEREVQARMSDHAGFVCTPDGVAAARLGEAAKAAQWRQMALCSEAVLSALDAYIAAGGGSHGARVLCDAAGEATPQSRLGPLQE